MPYANLATVLAVFGPALNCDQIAQNVQRFVALRIDCRALVVDRRFRESIVRGHHPRWRRFGRHLRLALCSPPRVLPGYMINSQLRIVDRLEGEAINPRLFLLTSEALFACAFPCGSLSSSTSCGALLHSTRSGSHRASCGAAPCPPSRNEIPGLPATRAAERRFQFVEEKGMRSPDHLVYLRLRHFIVRQRIFQSAFAVFRQIGQRRQDNIRGDAVQLS